MDAAERRVAVLHVVHQDPHGADVVQAVDTRLLAAHLEPDAVDVLRPAGDLRAHAGHREFARKDGDDVLDVALPIEPALVEQRGDRLVRFGLERAQRQVLELPLELPRRAGWRAARRDRAPRHLPRFDHVTPRVMRWQRRRPLGELEQHDADVLDHREQHFAQPLRLCRSWHRYGGIARISSMRAAPVRASRRRADRATTSSAWNAGARRPVSSTRTVPASSFKPATIIGGADCAASMSGSPSRPRVSPQRSRRASAASNALRSSSG
jgi:hypothetical protein